MPRSGWTAVSEGPPAWAVGSVGLKCTMCSLPNVREQLSLASGSSMWSIELHMEQASLKHPSSPSRL